MQKLAVVFTVGILIVGAHAGALPAAADSADVLEEECHEQLNLGDSGCECIRERAEDELSEDQQELVVAMVTQDQAASAELRADMTVEEITGAAEFMMSAPGACGGQ